MKVGDKFEVIVAAASQFKHLYKAGNCRVVVDDFDGDVSAIIGFTHGMGSFHVHEGDYKKIGCLTITKLK